MFVEFGQAGKLSKDQALNLYTAAGEIPMDSHHGDLRGAAAIETADKMRGH